jgi:hypothetical protein
LKKKGVKLEVSSSNSFCGITNSTLMSDEEGKYLASIPLASHDCDLSCPLTFTPQDIDGFILLNPTLTGSAGQATTIAYTKKNFVKLTFVNTDTIISRLFFHSHIGNVVAESGPYIIKDSEPVLIDFKKGMTQTVLVPSARGVASFLHFSLFDNKTPSKETTSQSLFYNDKDLRRFAFPFEGKDTVAYTLKIK